MRWQAGALLLGALLAAATAKADENQDLDLIPAGAQQPETGGEAPEARDARQRLYLENAFTLWSLRSALAVPFPPPPPPDWQERLFFDARKEWDFDGGWRLSYSGRLNFRAENDIDFPSQENITHNFREGFASWEPVPRVFVDLGRINVKSGVAAGFNPTDFFKTRAVVEPLSADPAVLREDRLGTLMVRAQHIWEGGSIAAAFAPAFYSPTKIYTNTNLPSFDPMFDRTNAHDRLLVKGSADIGGEFSPEFLLYREGSSTHFGANLTEPIGQKTVAYLEWAGGREASLIDRALSYGRQTGSLPANAPSVLPESSKVSFQNSLSAGFSYTTESKITFNLEYHFNQASFSRQDWRNWFGIGGANAANPQVTGELWYIRSYALDQQEPISAHSLFFRADWVDAFIPKLEITAFANVDLYDGSSLMQVTADYYLSNAWTVGALVVANPGTRHSNYGSLPQAAGALLKVARYF